MSFKGKSDRIFQLSRMNNHSNLVAGRNTPHSVVQNVLKYFMESFVYILNFNVSHNIVEPKRVIGSFGLKLVNVHLLNVFDNVRSFVVVVHSFFTTTHLRRRSAFIHFVEWFFVICAFLAATCFDKWGVVKPIS